MFDPEKDLCLICTELITHPVECSKCKTAFCNSCAKKWLQKANKCPKKCSEPWIIDHVFPKQILLRCPYSQKCNQIIYPEIFDHHRTKCDWAPEYIKTIQKLKNEYLCKKFHKLKYINPMTEKQISGNCADCQLYTKANFICKQCDTVYCKQCRSPPLTKIICPNKKHRYILRKATSTSYNCLKCGFCISQLKSECYTDSTCNVTICKQCYQILPKPCREEIENLILFNK